MREAFQFFVSYIECFHFHLLYCQLFQRCLIACIVRVARISLNILRVPYVIKVGNHCSIFFSVNERAWATLYNPAVQITSETSIKTKSRPENV